MVEEQRRSDEIERANRAEARASSDPALRRATCLPTTIILIKQTTTIQSSKTCARAYWLEQAAYSLGRQTNRAQSHPHSCLSLYKCARAASPHLCARSSLPHLVHARAHTHTRIHTHFLLPFTRRLALHVYCCHRRSEPWLRCSRFGRAQTRHSHEEASRTHASCTIVGCRRHSSQRSSERRRRRRSGVLRLPFGRRWQAHGQLRRVRGLVSHAPPCMRFHPSHSLTYSLYALKKVSLPLRRTHQEGRGLLGHVRLRSVPGAHWKNLNE